MRTGLTRGVRTTRRRGRAGRRDDPRRSGSDGRAAGAHCGAPRGAARGFTDLPPCDQQLIALLIEDPPVPYAEISARLGIPVGSIGPTRGRCLDRLRRYPAIAALITAETESAGSEPSGPAMMQSARSVDGRSETPSARPGSQPVNGRRPSMSLAPFAGACGRAARPVAQRQLAVLCRPRATTTPSTTLGRFWMNLQVGCDLGDRKDLAGHCSGAGAQPVPA